MRLLVKFSTHVEEIVSQVCFSATPPINLQTKLTFDLERLLVD